MYTYIINPQTKKKISVKSKCGIIILKKYIKFLIAGASLDLSNSLPVPMSPINTNRSEIDEKQMKANYRQKKRQQTEAIGQRIKKKKLPDHELFFKAVENGDESTVKSILGDGRVDPNNTNKYGFTSLILAAIKGHASVVKLLLADQRINPNSTDRLGNTALSIAALKGHVSVVKLLLSIPNVDPNISDHFGKTPLSNATFKENNTILKLLLADHRLNPNAITADGKTVLMYAASYGLASVVDLLLTYQHVDPNITDEFGNTAFTISVLQGHPSVVKLLLTNKRVHLSTHVLNNITTLASGRGNIPVMELLLADPRIHRIRPLDEDQYAQHTYDTALRNVKRIRRARFRGIVRSIIELKKRRFRASEMVYQPGGPGFFRAQNNFNNSRNLS